MCSVHTIEDRHFFSYCVSGSTRGELWLRQIRHICLQLFLCFLSFSVPFFNGSGSKVYAAWWAWCVLHRDRLLFVYCILPDLIELIYNMCVPLRNRNLNCYLQTISCNILKLKKNRKRPLTRHPGLDRVLICFWLWQSPKHDQIHLATLWMAPTTPFSDTNWLFNFSKMLASFILLPR